MDQLKKETRYEEVYGDTFSRYSHKEMQEFIEPFEVRFDRNGLNSSEIFKGKRCFDAGCGNGRGSIFMLLNGAAHVTAYDFSEKNIESTKKFTKDFGFSNVECVQGTLESIPFDDGAFDFVWCNGVIMHTGKPDACLSEISRLVKPNGNMWLYVYGAGGVYWRVIYHLRRMMKDVPLQSCINALKLMRYENRYIAEFIDDWYASYLRTYTNSELSDRLTSLGFSAPKLLKFGVDYDTSHRLNSSYSQEEKDLMGEGDLRYLLIKTSNEKLSTPNISEDEFGSKYNWPSVITAQIDPLFDELDKISSGNDWVKVAIASRIQRELRLLLTETRTFPMAELKTLIRDTIDTVGAIKFAR